MEEPREESRSNRWLLVALLILLLLLLLWILAALQLEPAAAGSRIDISLRSRLAADYSPGEAAPMGSLQLSIVGEIFEDLGLAPSEASAASDTVKIGLLAPVPTATARNYQGEPPATATIAPTKEPTEAPTEEPSSTASPQLFNTATDEPTEEPEKEAKTKPTDTPTTGPSHTPVTPSDTPEPTTPTATPIPPTATPVTPTATPTPITPTATATPTDTPEPSADTQAPNITGYSVNIVSDADECEVHVSISNMHVIDPAHSEGIDDGDADHTGIVEAKYRLDGGNWHYSGQLTREAGGWAGFSWDAWYSESFTLEYEDLAFAPSNGIHLLAMPLASVAGINVDPQTATVTPVATETPIPTDTLVPTSSPVPTDTPTPEPPPFSVEVWLTARDDAARTASPVLAGITTLPGSCDD